MSSYFWPLKTSIFRGKMKKKMSNQNKNKKIFSLLHGMYNNYF